MPTPDLPDWMVEKYTSHSGPKAPQAVEESQGRTLSLLEIGDTQQEREQLSSSDLESSRKRLDPATISRWTSEYAVQASSIYNSEKAMLSRTPTVGLRTAVAEGQKVFTDQAQMDKIIADVSDGDYTTPFSKAFKKARSSGLNEFEYNGELFRTQKKNETDSEWLTSLSKTGPTSPTFADLMQTGGITVAAGKQVNPSDIDKSMGGALAVIAPLFEAAGVTAEITSGKRERDIFSLHQKGKAFDIRLNTVGAEALQTLKDGLPGEPQSIKVRGKKATLWSDGTYQYIIHGRGRKIHLHVEEDSESKKK